MGMQRKRKLFWAKTGVILSVIPVLLWAHEYGPDPGYSGVPTDNKGATCMSSGCHDTAHGGKLNPSGGGVTVSFPNGTSYAPGVKQHLVVTISDANGPRAWGFQLTARNASSTSTMAGSFASTDKNTLVICGDSSFNTEQELDFPNSQTCPASKPMAFIEHSLAGYTATLAKTGSATYEFDWTPPAASVGNITIYIAANSGPASASPTQNNADVYTATYTLTPAAAGGSTPSITAIQNGASFQAGIVPGSWITIAGSNLSSSTDTWDKFITNGKLPTSVDGVSVKVGGQDAFVYYVSPTQINAIAPNVGTGSMQVTVTNGSATSSGTSASSLTVQPAFFLWNGKYAVATHLDGTISAANGTFSGVTTVPAKPGDYVILWGTGFGPTSPAAPSGVVTPSDQTYATSTPVSVTVGGTPATVYSNAAVLTPTLAAVYQLAVQIPSNAANGDLPVVATINGAQTPTGVSVSVHN
jgi:uncharacterized protein (TIGR03437 family)